jgi:hypothetical protein
MLLLILTGVVLVSLIGLRMLTAMAASQRAARVLSP